MHIGPAVALIPCQGGGAYKRVCTGNVATGFRRSFSKFACAEISFHTKQIHRHVHTFHIWTKALHTTDLPHLVARRGWADERAERSRRQRGWKKVEEWGCAVCVHTDSHARRAHRVRIMAHV